MTLKRILSSGESRSPQQSRENRPPSDADTRLPTVRLDHTGPPIWLYATSEIERRERARACVKEPWTAEWIETQIRPGEVLYDIGANVGVFSLLAARHCDNDITVVAFEPAYASYARLCENLLLNGCDGVVIPIPLALSSSNGLVGFTYRSREPGGSRHRMRETWRARRRRKPGARYEQRALAARLDDLVERYELPVPHHIKLDVDGWELRVLEGAKRTLRHRALKSLMIEVDPEIESPVTELLESHGLSAVSKHRRKAQSPAYICFHRR